jgi:K+-sensing histidine kinase KdpD
VQARDDFIAGAGISVEGPARIFGRFEQAAGHRQHGGFGVGQWLVKRLVGAPAGEITVESEPEAGYRKAGRAGPTTEQILDDVADQLIAAVRRRKVGRK